MAELRGIIQGDVLVRGAILAGIDDLRRNQWVLDYVMADMVQDELTAARYGANETQRLRDWFLGLYEGAGTGIGVYDEPGVEPPSWPCLSIEQLDSSEDENVLADVDADLSEEVAALNPVLAGPLTPTAFDPLAGSVTLPAGVTLPIVPGRMTIVSRQGTVVPILGVVPAGDALRLSVPPGTVADLTGMTIRAEGSLRVAMETAAFGETYRIGCYVASERVHLTYLHSLVVLILLRGREAFLEARGLERSRLRSDGVQRNEAASGPMPVWSRFITLSGVVRPVWPKARSGAIWGVDPSFRASAPDTSPSLFVGGDPATPDDEEVWTVGRP